jgi:hypothetical protein
LGGPRIARSVSELQSCCPGAPGEPSSESRPR